jgi:hypothetical protein
VRVEDELLGKADRVEFKPVGSRFAGSRTPRTSDNEFDHEDLPPHASYRPLSGTVGRTGFRLELCRK